MNRLTLITCTFERDAEFLRLIESIDAQEISDVQLIVVDQNVPARVQRLRTDHSLNYEVLVLETGRMGLSKARNLALANASGSIVGFPDDDCWYPYGFFVQLLKAFKDYGGHDFLTCKTVDEELQPSVGQFLASSQEIRKTNTFWAGNSNGIFIRKKALDEVDGFDERLGVGADSPYRAGEETDLLLKLLSCQAKGKYLADLFVHHPSVPENTESAVARASQYAPGIGKLMAMHQFPVWFVALRILRPAMSALYFAATLNFPRFRYKWVWSRNIAKGFFSKKM